MKASDEEEYGSIYSQRSSSSGYGSSGARYTGHGRHREYSPSRGHHSTSLSSGSSGPLGAEGGAYGISSNRSYTRTPPYGSTSGRNLIEYPPPCCHQFYHPPPPPVPLHPSPSHFNTIPHPPLQYRDVPACATLNRACYSNRRGGNNHYNSSNYYASENPYGDPRTDIYYTSTLTRHPSRHTDTGSRSSSRGYHSSLLENAQDTGSKLYDTPPAPPSYHQSASHHHHHTPHHPHASHHHVGTGTSGQSSGLGSSGSRSNYSSINNSSMVALGASGGLGNVGMMAGQMGSQGGPSSQTSLLRLEEPRIYSTSSLQLGGAGNQSTLARSNSPQQQPHFIDRSISLIRLDNSNNGAGAGSASNIPSGVVQGAGVSHIQSDHSNSPGINPANAGSQPRLDRFKIKFTPEFTSGAQAQSQPTSLNKTIVELGSSNDPLAPNSGVKSKYKSGLLEASASSSKPMVEMSDKAVMTSLLPEQWSLVSSGSEGRRISIGAATTPMGNSPPPAPTLSGGIPDLLPTCVVRQNDYVASSWRTSGNANLPSPRRSYLNSGGPSGGIPTSSNVGPAGSSSQLPSTSRGSSKSTSSSNYHSHSQHNNVYPRKLSRWAQFKKYVRDEARTFFGLDSGEKLKEEWLTRRKIFASRRYSERNVDSMPPPSPYQSTAGGHHPHQYGAGSRDDHHMDQTDGRIPTSDLRSMAASRARSRRTRKKDHVLLVYWNLLRWLFWSIKFGRAGQRVGAGAGCGSDTNPGSGSTSPGRVPLDSQMSRDRSKSRSVTPLTLADIPPSVTISPQELFFDDLDDNHRNSTHHMQPPGRGLHWRITNRQYSGSSGLQNTYRISSQLLNKVLDNSERQKYRQGLRQPTSSVPKLALIDEYEEFRPYFTYWVTIVQCIILITVMFTYGMAPFGVGLHKKSSTVLVTSLSLQTMEIMYPANFWVGPLAADLIHLGAKFAPCMRLDEAIHKRIDDTKSRERQTACCIRNDNSGCVQSSRNECSIKGASTSGLLSTWKKWNGDGGGRISGSVCGLDPKYCEAPASIAPYEWPDDITKWPICRKTRGLQGTSPKDKAAEHMVCEVIGHPCCIGIHAKCVITTRENCMFANGHFHEEASLCSQVSCLQDVCGMFPFLNYDQPDQFYRLISSSFLHAGFGHIFFTTLFSLFIMRDLEKLAGPLRVSIIYFGSGIAGNLASVLLEPHRAEVGPGGAQFGLIATLLVELLHMWGVLRRPWQALGKMILVILGFFVLGFLPWVDNFAHIAGFVAGFFLSHAVMPYISFGKYSSYRKWLEVVLSIALFFSVLLSLLLVFYNGFGDCEICKLLNCLPLTKDFCAEQDIDYKPSGSGYNLIT